MSLVQPYDGGGIGFQEFSTLVQEFTIPTGITDVINCIINDMNTIARIYAMGVRQIVGTDATVAMEIVSAAGIAIGVAIRDVGVASTTRQPFILDSRPLILGPGCTLRARTLSGGADSSFAVQVYAARAPLGTVFQP